jgi:hypothetical protein
VTGVTRATARLAVALSVHVVCPQTLLAQELEITDRSIIAGTQGQTTFNFAGTPQCDAKGNLFIAPLAGSSTEVDEFWRVSSDGRQVAHLRPRSVPGFESAGLQALAVDPDGQAHVLVAVPRKSGQSQQYIVTFDRKGESRSKPVRLEGLWATRLAVFDSGRYLVAGSAEHAGSTLFVVDASGNILTAVRPSGDPAKWPPDEPRIGDSPPPDDERFLAAMTYAESTNDDSVVVVRPTLEGPVFEISSSGEVARTFELVPPVGATRLAGVKVSRGRLAALYRMHPDDSGKPRFTTAVFDLATQVRLAEYSNALGVFTCYDTDGSTDSFSFLGAEERGLAIVRARPR